MGICLQGLIDRTLSPLVLTHPFRLVKHVIWTVGPQGTLLRLTSTF